LSSPDLPPAPPPPASAAAPDPAQPAAPLFVIRGLTKSFDGRRVLDALDFDIHRGECFVILGRSGSGKSVTLRQLNGLDRPDAGVVTFDGIEVSSLSERDLYPVRRRIAMLFQSGALFDSMTIFDNIAFPLREHTDQDEPAIAERVRQLLGLVNLPEVGGAMPSALSGGMRKRAALARSLALDPEVVLYDEPTTGLDPVTSATIAHLMRSVHRHLNVTQVVITHDIPLARRVGDRLAYLSGGSFRFLGDWAAADAATDRELADFLAGREPEGQEDDDHDGAFARP
jgi:phospholipid/cholesterol/gamma-HCH transport system ATP-binding protein